MNKMNISRLRKFTLLIALLLGFATTGRAVVVYNSTTSAAGTLTTESGVASYLQQITLNGPNTTYTISQMVIGINFNAVGNGQQDVFLDFYTGLNLSAGAADALAGATLVASEGVGLNDPGAAGSFAFTINFTTPFTVPSNTFGIVFSFLDDASFSYSTEISPLFRLGGAPSVGSNPGFAWNDANQDGVFPGSEQTKFGNATSANYYMSITATFVPEPGSLALMVVGGLGLLVGVQRRRRNR
jgi:hypothetical protein